MSNAKRFLSVILAMIMVCSTLVIGANAAYVAYKDSAIADSQYNCLDQAVLTTAQYASAAMDEVDRMLDVEQLKFTAEDIIVGDIDITSIDNTMDSVYGLVGGTLFQSLKGMLGDLGSLSVDAFKPEKDGGVRRGTTGKTDLDIIYSVFQLLYDNKKIFTDFVAGTINLGSILPSLVDLSEYTNVNQLLKKLLYEATYVDENGDALDAPDTVTKTIDEMVQDLINRVLVKEIPAFADENLDISSGSVYDMLDMAVDVLYNNLLLDTLNTDARWGINEFCGVEYQRDESGKKIKDEAGERVVDTEKTEMNGREALFNLDYTIPEFEFVEGTQTSDQINNVLKSICDAMIKSSVYVWQSGTNDKIMDNIVGLAKAILTKTGDDFFASYVEVADETTLNAMSTDELGAYALRAIINGSVDGMYIPESADSVRKVAFYTLKQLLATNIPELDFSDVDTEDISTDTIVVMGIDFAIYSVSAQLDMGLEYVYDMDGVEEQLRKACQYAIDNYGGILNGIDFGENTNAWDTLDAVIFSIIPADWIYGANGSVKTFLIDCLIDNVLDLDLKGILDAIFTKSTTSELNKSPKSVIANRVVAIFNIIFPGAMQTGATTIEALATNAALSKTVDAIFTDLYNYKDKLAIAILPTVCNMLDLTNEQNFEFPKLTYDKMVYVSGGNLDYDIKLRNSSSGINTGYTDADGDFHQDSLYTYDIKSVEGSTSTNYRINVTNPGQVPAGRSVNINLNGSVSAASLYTLKITYDVLTEDGSPLTDDPIEENVYIYLSKSETDEDAKFSANYDLSTKKPSAYTFSIIDGPLHIYARSLNDIVRTSLTVRNYTAADKVVNAASAIASKILDNDGNAWIVVNDEAVTVNKSVSDNDKTTYFTNTIKPFKFAEGYAELTSEEKEAVWTSIMEKNMKINQKTKKVSGNPAWTSDLATGVTDGTNTYNNTNFSICLYNDYGITSLVNNELNKHRQRSAYSNEDAWAAYQTALGNAVSAIYAPKAASGFSTASYKYEGFATALTTAIETLEKSALSTGVETLQAILDSFSPSNEGIEYDDPEYTYFGVADFVAYTYYNYRDERRNAQDLIDRATIPDEETGEVEAINELEKVYAEHRLSIFGARLLPTVATKQHLDAELFELTREIGSEEDYSAESWENFQRAYAFAEDVNNTDESELRQSKVDTALENLLEAEKRLVADTGSTGGDTGFTFNDPTGNSKVAPVSDGKGGYMLTGVDYTTANPNTYFTCTGCSAEINYKVAGKFSTGTVVTIKDDKTGATLGTYTVCVYTDVNGDGDVNATDVSQSVSIFGGSLSVDPCCKYACDMDSNNDISATDVSKMVAVFGGSMVADRVNRTTK